MFELIWLHVNRGTSKARLHVDGGCAGAIGAAERFKTGKPYGPSEGTKGDTGSLLALSPKPRRHRKQPGNEFRIAVLFVGANAGTCERAEARQRRLSGSKPAPKEQKVPSKCVFVVIAQ
jgi:hypothetical protein